MNGTESLYVCLIIKNEEEKTNVFHLFGNIFARSAFRCDYGINQPSFYTNNLMNGLYLLQYMQWRHLILIGFFSLLREREAGTIEIDILFFNLMFLIIPCTSILCPFAHILWSFFYSRKLSQFAEKFHFLPS